MTLAEVKSRTIRRVEQRSRSVGEHPAQEPRTTLWCWRFGTEHTMVPDRDSRRAVASSTARGSTHLGEHIGVHDAVHRPRFERQDVPVEIELDVAVEAVGGTGRAARRRVGAVDHRRRTALSSTSSPSQPGPRRSAAPSSP